MSTGILKVTEEALGRMLSHFRAELPREGCGLLAGRDHFAFRFYPIHNMSPDCRRFMMDPLHVKKTETSILRREQKIVAVCHSHPEGECAPSRWDIEGAFFDARYEMPLWTREVQVIALMDPVEEPTVRGFRIRVGGRIEEVPIEMVDGISSSVGEISTSI